MGGYYPDGVSGREWQIAGPDFEQDMERFCGADVETVPLHLAQEILEDMVAGTPVRPDDYAILLRQSQRAGTCGFLGEVFVTGYGLTYTWTCPACGTEHEDEEEPDDPIYF